jgi:hypothetical protein
MNDPAFCGLVQRGRQQLQRLGGIVFLARSQKFVVIPLQSVKAGFNALVLQILAGAVPHPAFG